jgi:hypothetical protein
MVEAITNVSGNFCRDSVGVVLQQTLKGHIPIKVLGMLIRGECDSGVAHTNTCCARYHMQKFKVPIEFIADHFEHFGKVYVKRDVDFVANLIQMMLIMRKCNKRAYNILGGLVGLGSTPEFATHIHKTIASAGQYMNAESYCDLIRVGCVGRKQLFGGVLQADTLLAEQKIKEAAEYHKWVRCKPASNPALLHTTNSPMMYTMWVLCDQLIYKYHIPNYICCMILDLLFAPPLVFCARQRYLGTTTLFNTH